MTRWPSRQVVRGYLDTRFLGFVVFLRPNWQVACDGLDECFVAMRVCSFAGLLVGWLAVVLIFHSIVF